MKKKILLFTPTSKVSAAVMEYGRSIGAQFRVAKNTDEQNIEPCDYVAGAVPKCYLDKFPVFPAEGLKAPEAPVFTQTGSTLPPQGDNGDLTAAQGASTDPDNPDLGGTDPENDPDSTNEDEGEELTLEYLESLEEAELLELAKDEEVHLTKADKKSAPKIRAAIAAHFELQE